ncbi:YbbR-like domain-containing protein [Psychroflexus lacisalsi]|jgi:hypothetical protein|uniref:YbbR-like domain-containing protein n=1 Tax=Psychroflexus lacisalsi TaxID=503928 RepID=A0ABP3VEA7_9FLAO|nr:hypothetical protein [Psychroflexus lacisalsi]MBZ9619326.1 hypothetical protein [Psychroflexus lacisalsi]
MSKYKQIDKLKTNLKKKNYKAFFFFIGFTLLIWIFVQMSKTYDHELKLSFQLKEVPQHIVIEDKSQDIAIEVNHTGFKILFINLFNSTLTLNFDELDSIGNAYTFNLKQNKSKIAKPLRVSSGELEILQDSLYFPFFKLTTKKLKIKPNFQVSFSKGYDSIENFSFDPSHIEVSGNDSILKDLEFISTEKKNLKDISDTLYGTVDIQKIDSVSINYLVETVKYTLPVNKFTEGNFEIPIDVENKASNEEFVIFPKTAKVNFKTSLSNYEKIDESGFKVVAKFEPDEDFMILELVKQPKFVKNVSLENYKVDYLIKR